jgi:ankyrin repeat protein
VVLGIHPLDLGDLLEPLKNTSEVNRRDSEGRTALHWAAARGDQTALLQLLTAGADINALDTNGRTPLIAAARLSRVNCLKELLWRKASIRIKDKYGCEAIHHAAQYADHLEVLQLLTSAGASIETKTVRGERPISTAVQLNKVNAARFLLDVGAYIDCSDEDGDTPLFETIIKGSHECLELLLQRGADHRLKNNDGWGVLHIAAKYADEETLRILRDADFNDLEPSLKDKYGKTPETIFETRTVKTLQTREMFFELCAGLQD